MADGPQASEAAFAASVPAALAPAHAGAASAERGDHLAQRTDHGPFGKIEFTERAVVPLAGHR